MRILYAKQSGIFIVVIREDKSSFRVTGEKLLGFNTEYVYYNKTGYGTKLFYTDSNQNEKSIDLDSPRYN